MQNDSADRTRQSDGSNGTQQHQQLEQFRYENDKLKIALAQRYVSLSSCTSHMPLLHLYCVDLCNKFDCLLKYTYNSYYVSADINEWFYSVLQLKAGLKQSYNAYSNILQNVQ